MMKFSLLDRRVRRILLTVLVGGVVGGAFLMGRSRPAYDAAGTGRRPLVLVGGQTQQIQGSDYISSVGGVTTNGSAAGSGDIETTSETVSSKLVDQGQFVASGIITVTDWTIDQTLSDWAPTGLASAYQINVSQSSGTTSINGIVAQPTGTEINICNAEASVGAVKLIYETGTAGNQFVLPTAGFNWVIQPASCVRLRYGGSNWRLAGTGTTEFPTITTDASATLRGATTINSLYYTVQYDTSTGTQDPFVLNSTTTLLVWAGASDATFKGMYGNADGHHVTIINASLGHTLTLGHQNGAGGVLDYYNLGGVDQVLVGSGSYATYDYAVADGGSVAAWQMTAFGSLTHAEPQALTSTKNKGSIVLSGGTGSATVNSGAICVCDDSTAALAVQCAVSSTTLTATGTGTDAISYLCF